MKIKKIVVTGDDFFLRRYKFMFAAMSQYFDDLECVADDIHYEEKIAKIFTKILYAITYLISPLRASRLNKNAQAFITRSRQTERKIRRLSCPPDLVFHIYSMYCPFWDQVNVPYAMYLDYTMTLAKRTWSPWAPFPNLEELASWLNCARLAYQQATHLFTVSHFVKSSLVNDYSIEANKITVVGASGNFQELCKEEKAFGSKQILFNGSDFKRKGGDLVLAAFKKVKQVLPEVKLVVIGKKLSIHEDGIDNPGYISSRLEIGTLFLKTDLVVAPAYCDPFPSFLIECMNYGIPCIVSANDGMPEIIDHDVNGIVIHQPTANSLANQIINLLNNPSALISMSQAARCKVMNKLNWDYVARNISQVLSD